MQIKLNIQLLTLLLYLSTYLCDYINTIYYLGKNIPQVYDFKNFDLDRVSHILYAFADIKDNKAIVNFTTSDVGKDKVLTGHLGSLIKIKQEHRHVKVGISILGDFGTMVENADSRSTFVDSVIDLMQNFGFDFVDLDWEFPVYGFEKLGVKGNKDDAKYMVALLKEFDEKFKSKLSFRAYVTLALPAPEYFLKVYDFKGIDPYIEYYNTMTYDFSGPFSDVAYHASNLLGPKGVLSVDTSIQLMLKYGVPANKLLLGIPAYAVVFRGCKEKKLFTSYDKEMSVQVGDGGYAGTSAIKWDKFETIWDDEAKSNWGWYEDQKMMISYESARAAALKIDYIKKNDLKGVMVWSLSQDFPINDNRSLVATTTDKLGVDKLDKTDNNINYPNSPYANVKNPSFKFDTSIISSYALPNFYFSFNLVLLLTLVTVYLCK